MPETAATADTRTPSGRLALAASDHQIALGPLDGRYQSAVAPLVDYLSEAALNRDRVAVEVEWLIHLTGNNVLPGAGPLSAEQQDRLRAIVTEFDAASVQELADIEAVTVHDVKAVEYYIGRRLPAIGIENLTAMVHFGCTSEDINNLSYALGVKGAVEDVWLPAARALVAQISKMAEDNRAVPMLSRTHGQPATLTTQIASHDWQAELYADVARFNRILHNVCTDIWSYISIGYFAQIPVAGATGSSTMPHKVNPIRFENAEANLEISSGLLDVLGSTLVTSRWQRDLTDSSSQRNIGVAFGHSLLAISNVAKGLERLDVAEDVLAADLDTNWEVLGEAIQMVMRAEAIAGVEGMENPYERLKDLTRGQRVDAARMQEFVQGLGLSPEAEARLLALTPGGYTGIADQLVDHLK